MDEIIKKDSNTITLITPVSTDFTYEDLMAQKANLQAQKDLATYQIDQQLASVQAMLDKCAVFKVTAKVEEVIDVPVIEEVIPVVK